MKKRSIAAMAGVVATAHVARRYVRTLGVMAAMPVDLRSPILPLTVGSLSERSLFESGRLARELDAAIVSPDYRLAPEHPFPAALDDRTVLRDDHGDRGLFMWTPASSRWAWTAYLGREPRHSDAPEYAAPARRDDLAGLPPACPATWWPCQGCTTARTVSSRKCLR